MICFGQGAGVLSNVTSSELFFGFDKSRFDRSFESR